MTGEPKRVAVFVYAFETGPWPPATVRLSNGGGSPLLET
jgi:hypothetical protein